MISTSFTRTILRMAFAVGMAVFFAWLFEAPKFVAILLYFIIYVSFLVVDLGQELNERLKALGAFIDGDDEFDDDTSL